MTKKLLFLAVATILTGIALSIYNLNKGGDYPDGLMKLGMRSTAHLMCSCLYVSENDEAFCREYAALKQVSPWIRVNAQEKIVDARLFLFFSGQAQYVGKNAGCKILQ